MVSLLCIKRSYRGVGNDIGIGSRLPANRPERNLVLSVREHLIGCDEGGNIGSKEA